MGPAQSPDTGTTTFPTGFASMIRTNPEMKGQSGQRLPKGLWDRLNGQIEQAGGRVQGVYELPFVGEYDLLVVGHADQPQAIVRIAQACKSDPDVLQSTTSPAEEIFVGQHLETAGSR